MIVGYVVMPEHIQLLVTEPEVGTPSTVMQVLKQRTVHALLPKKKRKDPRQRGLFGDEAPRRSPWTLLVRFPIEAVQLARFSEGGKPLTEETFPAFLRPMKQGSPNTVASAHPSTPLDNSLLTSYN